MEKLHIPYPVVVEGKYDRLRLLSVMEGQIITTDGFGIFKKQEKLALLRALAALTPLIVLTDPDGAGTLIRSHITSAIPKERIIPLYVPQAKGKEARKRAPSAAGFLGVEGQDAALLYDLLSPFAGDDLPTRGSITKADFYEDGLTGRPGASDRRNALAAHFGLPPDMTPNALLAALNIITDKKAYKQAAAALLAREASPQ